MEHLEQFAASSDSEKDAIECLQKTVTHLELEEAKKIEERQRNDLELQQIEEHYKQETRYVPMGFNGSEVQEISINVEGKM